MEIYQQMQNECDKLEEMKELNDKQEELQQKRKMLETLADTQIKIWQEQLKKLQEEIKTNINKAFAQFETQLSKEKQKVFSIREEG